MRRKNRGDASAKGGEDDQECRRECWTSSHDHKANYVEGRSTDVEERGGRREIAGTLRSKKKIMFKKNGNAMRRYRIAKQAMEE